MKHFLKRPQQLFRCCKATCRSIIEAAVWLNGAWQALEWVWEKMIEILAMREDYLYKYLSEKKLALVFYSLGEKYVTQKGTYQSIGHRYDLSGAYRYSNGKFDEIQAMHISYTLQKGALFPW